MFSKLFNRCLKPNRLPDFLILGAQKAGTTALYEILCQHPQIVDRPGEVHFFDVYYERGIDWYKAQFPKTPDRNILIGDKSPYYLFHPLAPSRAHSLLPNAKLLVLLRNPIDRAYSQYWMNIRKNQEWLPFDEAIQAEKERLAGQVDQIIAGLPPSSTHRHHSYLSRGYYAEQLLRWRTYYPPEKMHLILYDELRKDPGAVVKRTLSFLGLKDYEGFNFKVGKESSYPPMSSQMRKQLVSLFEPHNAQLELLLNRKLDWGSF